MGFKRGASTHINKGIHHFRNDPDLLHQTCTRCGCKRVHSYKNATGSNIYSFYDRWGNLLSEMPTECKGLYDLLNEE